MVGRPRTLGAGHCLGLVHLGRGGAGTLLSRLRADPELEMIAVEPDDVLFLDCNCQQSTDP
jgi:hypothetical protein